MAGQGNMEKVGRRPNATKPRTRRRRWFQFSLRTALAGTFLWAVVLGLWSVYLAPFQRQKAAIVRLRERGIPRWTYDRSAQLPRWIAWILGDESFNQAARGVWLPEGIGDEDLAEMEADLASLPWLRDLEIQNSHVTDEGLRHLARLVTIENLHIYGAAVRGEGFRHLAGFGRLRMVTTQRTPLSDEALYWLGRHPTLEALALEDTELTNGGLLHLDGLVNLGFLQVRSPRITDAGLANVLGVSGLVKLDLRGTSATEGGLVPLKALPKLRLLRVPGHEVELREGRWESFPSKAK